MVTKRGRPPGGRSQLTPSDLMDMAIRHFELGEPVDALAVERGVEQSTVRRWLAKAKKDGLVRTLVVPYLHSEENTRLRHDLRYKYELEDVLIVPGREDVLDEEDEESAAKEAVVINIAQAAARYLEEHLTNRDTLLVPWGRMANYIARQIRPARPLPGINVVPMEGVLGIRDDPFEANVLASTIAAKFGGRGYQLAAPAVVDQQMGALLEQLPLVQHVLSLYKTATVAIVPIASPDPERSTVVRAGLLSREAVQRLVKRGAVGEIASHWWFDSAGKIVTQDGQHAIGLGLDGLTQMVKRRGKVMAVVGASRGRIPPLRVALTCGLINVLVTDHVTAQLLV